MDTNMKILIVDDFSTMRRIIKNLLRDLGFNNTSEAEDGAAGLAALRAGDFDFLVTDWNMPGMQRIDLLKAVRADTKLANIPVLMAGKVILAKPFSLASFKLFRVASASF